MKLFNPCNKCLVSPSCRFKDDCPVEAELNCPLLYDYLMTIKILLYIPNHISLISKDVYKSIKFMYRGEPFFIKIMLSMLLICQAFSMIMCVGLAWALVYTVFT